MKVHTSTVPLSCCCLAGNQDKKCPHVKMNVTYPGTQAIAIYPMEPTDLIVLCLSSCPSVTQFNILRLLDPITGPHNPNLI